MRWAQALLRNLHRDNPRPYYPSSMELAFVMATVLNKETRGID